MIGGEIWPSHHAFSSQTPTPRREAAAVPGRAGASRVPPPAFQSAWHQRWGVDKAGSGPPAAAPHITPQLSDLGMNRDQPGKREMQGACEGLTDAPLSPVAVAVGQPSPGGFLPSSRPVTPPHHQPRRGQARASRREQGRPGAATSQGCVPLGRDLLPQPPHPITDLCSKQGPQKVGWGSAREEGRLCTRRCLLGVPHGCWVGSQHS